MQQNLHLHKPLTTAVSPETMAAIEKDRMRSTYAKEEKMTPVNSAEIPALLMQALAQLVVTAAEMVEVLEEISDSHDELVWLAEKAAIRQGIVTQEQINEQNKPEPESIPTRSLNLPQPGADRV